MTRTVCDHCGKANASVKEEVVDAYRFDLCHECFADIQGRISVFMNELVGEIQRVTDLKPEIQ